jgi:dihydroorotase
MRSLKIKAPFDAHVHLREGEMLKNVVAYTAQYCKDSIVMPNLEIPITTVKQAKEYKKQVEKGYKMSCNFHMTLYLTDETTPEEIEKVAKDPNIIGFKYYPPNATTNSSHGVTNLKKIYPLLKLMEDLKVFLLLHGEVVDKEIDIFKREEKFINNILKDIVKTFPKLKISLEHITTKAAVEFISSAREGVVATITPQHLLKNRNDIFTRGEKTALNNDNFCLPILKKETDRQALLRAIKTNSGKFFAGTDSAPHLKEDKNTCGCAGCFTAPCAIELYATAFEEVNCLDKIDDFLSIYGRNFYGIPIPKETLTIEHGDVVIPENIHGITPFMAGETLLWQVA